MGPVAPRDRAVHGRPAVGGRQPGGRLPAPDPARAARAPRGARHAGRRRDRTGVPGLPRLLRRGRREGLDQPAPREPLQRRLLHARHRARRAAAPADPQRDGGRRAAGGELQGRVQPRPARDQLRLRTRAPDRRRAHDLQERGQGDRRPGGHGDQLHGQVRRARGQLLPHPPLAPARRRLGRVRGRRRGVRPLPGRPAGLPARALLPVRAERELLQALRGGLVRADGRGLGQRQPDLRPARRGPWAEQADRAAAAGRRRQPVPRAERDHRRRAARDRRGARARARLRGQRVHVGQAARAGHAAGARDTFAAGSVGRAAFGDEVVDHYLNAADVELAAFEATVTDWERARGFERL